MGAAIAVAACISLHDVTIITRGTPSNAHRTQPLSPYTSRSSSFFIFLFVFLHFFFPYDQLLCQNRLRCHHVH